MLLFNKNKLDPVIKLKLKEKSDKSIPAIISLKVPPSNRFKNSISKNGGKLKYTYDFINAVSGQFTPGCLDRLSELPEVMYISYDRNANVCMDKVPSYIGIDYRNPYSLTGKGVNIAIIDTGVFPHGDLTRPYRVITYFKDFINSCEAPYDDNGHGTHISGIIAGSGVMSDGKYRGLAPNSKIIMLKAFNSVGEGQFSNILESLQWVVENREKYNIKMLCLPFGADAIVPSGADPLCRACRAMWDLGVIVVAAAGNKGPNQGSITTPGIEPSVITAGSCECRDSNIRNWKIADFSGRGSKKGGTVKPEIIGPGVNIISLASNKTYLPSLGRRGLIPPPPESPYIQATGSSVSTAITAGCIALLLEKMPSVSGKDLKGILKLSSQTLNESSSAQGYGVINLKELK